MTSRAPTTPAMMDVTWLHGKRSSGSGRHPAQNGGGKTQPHSYLGFWSTGHPSSSRIVHLGTQGVAPCCQQPPAAASTPWPPPFGLGTPNSRVGAVGGAELAHAKFVRVFPDGHEGGVGLDAAGAAPHALLGVLVVGTGHALVWILQESGVG